jgi:7,8-dihydroneopterin aldolase/epimerase/oxygenase
LAGGKPREKQGAGQLSDGGVPDRISLRDYTVSCFVGAFEEEKHSKQRVRFNVEVSVTPSGHRGSDDVSHVVSYDMIVEAIHAVLDEGHINLLETIAERVAVRCLVHKRAVKVRILVEKLDRLEGASLGVEIERIKQRKA